MLVFVVRRTAWAPFEVVKLPPGAGKDVALEMPRRESATWHIRAADGTSLPRPAVELRAFHGIRAEPPPVWRQNLQIVRSASDSDDVVLARQPVPPGAITMKQLDAGVWESRSLLPPGDYLLRVRCAGFEPFEGPLPSSHRLRTLGDDRLAGPRRDEVVLQRTAHVCLFSVVDSAEAPIAGATVVVDGAPRGRTDERGELAVASLASRRLAVTAWHPHYSMAQPMVVERVPTNLRIQLPRTARLQGHVLERGRYSGRTYVVTAQAWDRRQRAARTGPWLEPRTTLTGLDGRFDLQALTPGTWCVTVRQRAGVAGLDAETLAQLAARQRQRAPEPRLVDVQPGGLQHVEVEWFVLEPAEEDLLGGQVRFDGVPRGNVLVRLAAIEKERSLHRVHDSDGWRLQVTAAQRDLGATCTDAAGRFVFPRTELDPRNTTALRLSLSETIDGVTHHHGRRTLPYAATTKSIDIDIVTGRLELELLFADGTPVPNRVLVLEGEGDQAPPGLALRAWTNDHGWARTQVPAGSYRVRFADGGAAVSRIAHPAIVVPARGFTIVRARVE
jgi:hypothetical protein